MIKYNFEFLIGRNYRSKAFLHREDAFAYGIKIKADRMREICHIMPNEWEKPSILAELFADYKKDTL